MTDAQIRKVLSLYYCELVDRGYYPEKRKDEYTGSSKSEALKHASWMIDQMKGFLEEGKREKLMRWLGFVEGCLWMGDIFTIDAMKEHTRPDVQVAD